MQGQVARLLSDKGFGFIKATDGVEYFFHRSSVNGSFEGLREGHNVTFDLEESPKGPRGKNVTVSV